MVRELVKERLGNGERMERVRMRREVRENGETENKEIIETLKQQPTYHTEMMPTTNVCKCRSLLEPNGNGVMIG